MQGVSGLMSVRVDRLVLRGQDPGPGVLAALRAELGRALLPECAQGAASERGEVSRLIAARITQAVEEARR